MLSSDTQYFIKLWLSKYSILRRPLGLALLSLSLIFLISRKYFWFSRLLGKYEKLNEDYIPAESTGVYNHLSNARKNLLKSSSNKIYESFLRTKQSQDIKKFYARFNEDDKVRIRHQNEDDDNREGALLVLKEAIFQSGKLVEKGVLYLQYNKAIFDFATLFDVEAVYANYILCFEPSSWGYSDICLELILHGDHNVYIMAQDEVDFEIVKRLDSRLVPIKAGAGDWINFDSPISPKPFNEKQFSICMVASWRKLKNHKLMFKKLSPLGKGFKFALIGYPWENRTVKDIRKEQEKYYPDSMIAVFELVPHEYVFRVLADSKVALMLSEREGANRGIYEAISSNVPVVMLRSNRGVNKNLVKSDCVYLASEADLAEITIKALNDAENSNVASILKTISGSDNTWSLLSNTFKHFDDTELDAKCLVKTTPNLKYVTKNIKSRFDAEYDILRTRLKK